MNKGSSGFEWVLWQSRWVAIVPVVASFILATGVLLISAVDSVVLVGQFLQYVVSDDAGRAAVRIALIGDVVEIIDGFLLGAILIIFSMGLYELFISKIDSAEVSDFGRRLLLIRSLDDLKNRLASVVILILVVKFFQLAIKQRIESPVDLLVLALGIFFIGAALLATNRTVKDDAQAGKPVEK